MGNSSMTFEKAENWQRTNELRAKRLTWMLMEEAQIKPIPAVRVLNLWKSGRHVGETALNKILGPINDGSSGDLMAKLAILAVKDENVTFAAKKLMRKTHSRRKLMNLALVIKGKLIELSESFELHPRMVTGKALTEWFSMALTHLSAELVLAGINANTKNFIRLLTSINKQLSDNLTTFL